MNQPEPELVGEYRVLVGTATAMDEDGGLQLPMMGLVLLTNQGERVFAITPPMIEDIADAVKHACTQVEWPADLAMPKPTRMERFWRWPDGPYIWLLPVVFGAALGVGVGLHGQPRLAASTWNGYWTAYTYYWMSVGLMYGSGVGLRNLLHWYRHPTRAKATAPTPLDGSHEAL